MSHDVQPGKHGEARASRIALTALRCDGATSRAVCAAARQRGSVIPQPTKRLRFPEMQESDLTDITLDIGGSRDARLDRVDSGHYDPNGRRSDSRAGRVCVDDALAAFGAMPPDARTVQEWSRSIRANSSGAVDVLPDC